MKNIHSKIILTSALLLSVWQYPVSGKMNTISHRELIWNNSKVHILTIPAGAKVRPAARRPGFTVPEWALREGAVAAINGGYFNHSDGWPVSHVLVDGLPRTEPGKNQALLNNPALKPILHRIFDKRSEFRVLTDNQQVFWQIASHTEPVTPSLKLVHALQAGPQLLPVLNLVSEGFIIKDKNGRVTRDGIGSFSAAARSAIGLTREGNMVWVAVSGSGGGNKGLNIMQLAALMKYLKCQSAMALDGGSSTTITWKENKKWKIFTGSGKGPVRVNSVLTVLP